MYQYVLEHLHVHEVPTYMYTKKMMHFFFTFVCIFRYWTWEKTVQRFTYICMYYV